MSLLLRFFDLWRSDDGEELAELRDEVVRLSDENRRLRSDANGQEVKRLTAENVRLKGEVASFSTALDALGWPPGDVLKAAAAGWPQPEGASE